MTSRPVRVDESFRITFGLGEAAPRRWDGEVLPDPGRTVVIELDRFRNHDYSRMGFTAAGITQIGRGDPPFPNDQLVPPLGWVVSTREASLHGPTTEWHVRTEEPAPVIESPSILVHVAGGSARQPVRVTTANGSFAFVPGDVPAFAPATFVDGAVLVERVPSVSAVEDAILGQQDFPALLATESDEQWVAWQEFDGSSDSVRVRRWRNGAWEATATLTQDADVFRTALGRDGHCGVWATWSMQRDGRWNLYARVFDGTTWGPLRRLTRSAGSDAFQGVATDSLGRLWLVWQRVVSGVSQIFAKSFDGRRWSRDRQVSTGASAAGNNWWPVVAAGPDGSIAVAWDGYAGGSYDVYLRHLRGSRLGAVRTIAATAQFQAHPSIAIDADGRTWVAWDESGVDWGKDTGFRTNVSGTQLHESRRIRVACLDESGVQTTAGDLGAVLSSDECWELPHLVTGTSGPPWLLARHRVPRQPDTPSEAPIDLALWEIHLTRHDGDQWLAPICLPRSTGRNEQLPATAVGPDGRVWAAWATDGRDTRSWLPHQHRVVIAELGRIEPEPAPVLVPLGPQSPEHQPPRPPRFNRDLEREQIARVRTYRIRSGGRSYGIYRGDLHRHTDISLDGGNDGSLLDAYRYARDAAGLDFLGVTDHTDGVDDEYAWWRTQKIADIFDAPGSFVAFYGYERSVEFPNGHGNVFFTRRGARVTPISAGEHLGWEGAETLHAYLRRQGGFAIPHTTGRTSGTDWRDNDPHVEPLVELYQGMRDSYEVPDAPRPYLAGAVASGGAPTPGPVPRASSLETSPSFRRAGFVDRALAKGHRLGFIASSDHISAHISYACVIAETLSREGLLEAVHARRTYAATDDIVLDVRFHGSQSEQLMGAELETADPLRIGLRVVGTAPILRIDVIRDGGVIHTVEPGSADAAVEFVDNQGAPIGRVCTYYVRVVQADGGMAWGSPAWVTRS